ncbi:MAG: hypothetical protein JST00_22075 [Deltaproteobacteria bacterium]|nr:hypothetical protein [Deltaproteobacteria bacterium]
MATRDRLSVVAAVALALASVTPGTALAQPTDPPRGTTEHETAMRSGLDHYAQGNFVAAIATWESLLATIGEQRGYKVLYNLGLAYQQIGDVTHGIERYRAFVKQVAERGNADPDLVSRSDDAAKRVADLESTHGAVFVKPPARGGAVLTRVGTADARAAGYVVWLAPGTHTVEVFVGTSRSKIVRVEVVKGEQVEVDTTPPEEPAPPPPALPVAPPPAPATSARTTWLLVGAGATVVSFALPLTLYGVASGKQSDAEALGPGHTGYAAAKDSYESARTVYAVSYALPIAVGLTTAIVYLAWKSDKDRPVNAAVGLGGVSLSGRF